MGFLDRDDVRSNRVFRTASVSLAHDPEASRRLAVQKSMITILL